MKLMEATMLALQGKLEAKNPENDEINTKIRKSLNGSTKYVNDLKDAGLNVSQDEKGKVQSIGPADLGPNDEYKFMNKQDLKNSHPDTDYYNYITKKKERPLVKDTGAFEPMNAFRNSDSFEKVASKDIYRSEDRNGVSGAIPKRYKTGRKNYNVDLDKFPQKDYNGVASYEPLDNQELQDFKYNKSKVSDDGWLKRDLDKAKAEYDRVKADYDKVNDQVQSVRDRVAKSKANRKAEARSHKEDNERVAPRDIDKLDVSLGNVGNFAPKNSTGNKYTGTTEADYRSKRNRTGRKNDDGVDEYITYNNHYDTAVPTYQDFKWNADEFEKEANKYKNDKYKNDKRGQYATKMMISHQKEADKVVDRVREKITNKKTESTEDTDAKNIQAIQDVLKKSGITSERTLDLMSKDILKDLKRNYTKGCKDEYGNYYGTVITDAFRKKVQQITGKMPDLKISESKEIKEEKLGRNRKIRK